MELDLAWSVARRPSYFALHRLAEFFTPADHYAAVRYAASEAVSAGITTCHDWANGLRDRADAEAEAQALVDSGIRARFGYGNLTSPSRPGVVAEDLVSLQAWIDRHAEGLMTSAWSVMPSQRSRPR